jgi:argininosuccinate lyase
MSQHLWSGRFDAAPDPAAFDFGVSFAFDRRLFEDDVTGSLAWADALAEAGVLDANDAGAIREGLTAILEQGRRDPAWVNGPDEDVHSFVERQLVARIGDAGRRLHTGRSRNEQVSVDLRLYLRRRIPLLQQALRAVIAALADQAEAAGEALMPSYTHLRRAMPVLVSHYLLSHAAALQRDHARLAQAREEADALPLGSGAIAGTGYGIDTAALARRLGFSRVVANSMDASSDRDFAATFLYATTVAMVHLSRLAEDLILFTGEEFGYFELADASATGSSMMPQKKNPDPLELVRGKAGRTIGHLTGLLVTMKGLPTGYNKDLQEDKEAVFEAFDQLASLLPAVRGSVATMEINTDRCAAAVDAAMLATDVADHLVKSGVPFREAHGLVGRLVRASEELATPLDRLPRDVFDNVSPHFAGADLPALFDARRALDARAGVGGTAPAAVAEQIAALRARL